MSASPTVRFAGLSWSVKVSDHPVGPGPNLFSAANVSVDAAGRLQLSVRPSAKGWTCAEVIAQGEFGYGSYRWSVVGDITFGDPNVVLGMFTWSDMPDQANRELDIEFSRWGRPRDPEAGSFTVQTLMGPITRRFIPRTGDSEHRLIWTPGRVEFTSSFGSRVRTWIHEGPDVPTPGGSVAPRMNLWLFQGCPAGAAATVTIRSFAWDARG